MRIQPPFIYVRPDIEDVKVLEFHKAEQIFQQSEPAKRQLREALEAQLLS